MTIKKAGIWATAAMSGLMMAMPLVASAQIGTGLDEFNEKAQLGENDLRETIGEIVRVVLGFLGLLAVLLVLWAGFLWMTATGNEDQIGKAKGILISAVIGLIIIMSAYAITTFIFDEFGDATGTTFSPDTNQ
ncbi:MAG: hypothetical protein AAB384_03990 [Patescibacteria group bacterium]|mgnify:CR=1 FL=1